MGKLVAYSKKENVTLCIRCVGNTFLNLEERISNSGLTTIKQLIKEYEFYFKNNTHQLIYKYQITSMFNDLEFYFELLKYKNEDWVVIDVY